MTTIEAFEGSSASYTAFQDTVS